MFILWLIIISPSYFNTIGTFVNDFFFGLSFFSIILISILIVANKYTLAWVIYIPSIVIGTVKTGVISIPHTLGIVLVTISQYITTTLHLITLMGSLILGVFWAKISSGYFWVWDSVEILLLCQIFFTVFVNHDYYNSSVCYTLERILFCRVFRYLDRTSPHHLPNLQYSTKQTNYFTCFSDINFCDLVVLLTFLSIVLFKCCVMLYSSNIVKIFIQNNKYNSTFVLNLLIIHQLQTSIILLLNGLTFKLKAHLNLNLSVFFITPFIVYISDSKKEK